MYILAIDTSTNILGVAILKNDQVIGEVVTNIQKTHSPRLMPAINSLMKKVELTPDQLGKIVVSKGPGSYTGVRIGLTTAKSLAWALNIPIVGISSLEALAYQGRFFTSYICTFFDARRETVFTVLSEWKNNNSVKVQDEKNILMKDWLSLIATYNKPVVFLSPHIHLYEEMIQDQLGELSIIPEQPYHLIKPSFVALASFGKTDDDVHTLTP